MIQLHSHSDYSILDSILQIPRYVAWVKDHGQTAAALTDHGTLGGLVDFWFECKAQGIKPILGCEFYHSRTVEDQKIYHLVLLARNRIGFNNLIALSVRGQEQFYKRSRITDADLHIYGSGLIGLSGCLNGYVAQAALAGNMDHDWIKYAEKCLDGFYLEIMDNGIEEQEVINKAFRGGGVCVATNDVHYATEKDVLAHGVVLAVKTRKKLGAKDAFVFSGSGYWLREELDVPQAAMDLTHDIADQVEEYQIGYDDWQLPNVDLNPDDERVFLDKCLVERELVTSEYKERLKFEFEVIERNGLLPYFKIVAGLYEHFRSIDRFVGWGRGSTGGSLVAYLYGITNIDPLEWGLLFERFLNPGRMTMPDIDMDFQPSDREEAIEQLRKYGAVYQVGSYSTFGTREVILAVSKAMDVPTRLLDYVPYEAPIPTVRDLITQREFANQVEIEENEELIDVCLRLEGVKKNHSIHAAGVVLTSDDIPVRQVRSGAHKGVVSTEWDMYALEKMKYIKFDILGVRNLEMIDTIAQQVGVRVKDIPLDDEKTMKLICDCDTIGVFQWESDGYRRVIRRLHPDTFEELLDLNTLYRPGCLESGITDEYIARKHGQSSVVQLHPKLNMGHQGLPLYQEDILQLAKDLAGFTLARADVLRKAIGKKEKKTFEELKEEFIDGCIGFSGMGREEAVGFWTQLEKFSRYTWNRAHAVAYTLISWWTAFFSATFPEEFLCGLLNQAGNTGRRRILLSECRRRGARLDYPNIDKSTDQFQVIQEKDGKTIYLGLGGIKFVGEKSLSKILAARKDGPFKDKDDLKKRAKISSRIIDSLTKAGAFGGELPTLEDEREILGCNIRQRLIEQYWWHTQLEGLGEVIDVHKILTKKGKPMAFLSVEYLKDTESVTVFPDLWKKIKGMVDVGTVAVFKKDERDVLQRITSPDAFEHFVVDVIDPDGFLSFYPSLVGKPNIRSNGTGIARIELDEDILYFIDREFGINKIVI